MNVQQIQWSLFARSGARPIRILLKPNVVGKIAELAQNVTHCFARVGVRPIRILLEPNVVGQVVQDAQIAHKMTWPLFPVQSGANKTLLVGAQNAAITDAERVLNATVKAGAKMTQVIW